MANAGARTRSGFVAALFLGLLASQDALAGPLPKESTPDPLKTWVPWVVNGAEDKLCPYPYNDGELRQCSWPSRGSLTLGAKGGTFTQQVAAFRTLWMPLPGEARRWPLDVKL